MAARTPQSSSEAGLTLVEVMVAMLLLVLQAPLWFASVRAITRMQQDTQLLLAGLTSITAQACY